MLEETGYDIAGLIKEEDYIELTIREQRMRLYIVVGVPEDASFAPITRKEISVRIGMCISNWDINNIVVIIIKFSFGL